MIMTKKYADQSTESISTIVTGGTGLLGRWLLPILTARGERVLVPIRRAEERADELRSFVVSLGGVAERLVIVPGDLDAPGLGFDESVRGRLRDVRFVYHLGARFAWGLDPAEARRTNVLGSVRMVELAATLPALERLVLVGGYRIAERLDRDGRPTQPSVASMEEAGPYEASKHEAHRAAVDRARELGVPYSAIHPASVIGDSRTGMTVQKVGLGETVLALAEGRMPARVGSPETWVPVVTVDFVADVLAAIARDPESRGLELTLLDPSTPLLDGLIDRTARILGKRPPRFRLPLGLVRRLPECVTQTPRETLAFLDSARYPLEATEAFLARHGLAHPDFEASFERWVRAIVGTQRVAASSIETAPRTAA